MRKPLFITLSGLVGLVGVVSFSSTGRTAPSPTDWQERVLIRTPKPYQRMATAIEAAGGKVTKQYKYVDPIAAEIPHNALISLRTNLTPGAISKDLIVNAPTNVDTTTRKGMASSDEENQITAEDIQSIPVDAASGSINPNAYLINNSIMNVTPLLAGGTTGKGVIVAVIDSGIRPGFPHISLDGSVVGCEDFVGDALGCMNSGNNGHGTFVAGMISANVNLSFSPASTFRNAVAAECPSCFSNPLANTVIPMVGTAPLSSIYALRIFGPAGGAPTSRVIAAMERAIELREKYNEGDPSGRNIKVCNMSLGGETDFAGRDLLDLEANVALLPFWFWPRTENEVDV